MNTWTTGWKKGRQSSSLPIGVTRREPQSLRKMPPNHFCTLSTAAQELLWTSKVLPILTRGSWSGISMFLSGGKQSQCWALWKMINIPQQTCYPQNWPLSGAPGHWARCRLVLVTLGSHVQIRCQQVRAAVSGAGMFIDWIGFTNYIQDMLQWNIELPISYHLDVKEGRQRAILEAISPCQSCLFRKLKVLRTDTCQDWLDWHGFKVLWC